MKPARRPARRRVFWLAGAVFLLAATVGVYVRDGGWDQTYYLAEVSSLLEDGDLDLRNDVLHVRLDPFELQRLLITTLPDGTLLNTFTVGPALFWLPAYAPGMALRALGWASAARWNDAQFAGLHLLSLLMVLGVVWFLDRWLRFAGVKRGPAFGITLALLMATPLLVYGLASYTMSHLVSVAAACWFVAAVVQLERRPTAVLAGACGVALGLVFLARWQGVVVALALLPALATWLRDATARRRLPLLLLSLAAGFFAIASLQMRAWHLELGSWITLPQGGAYMQWGHPELWRFLGSGINGLFVWSPIFLVAILGLSMPWRLRLPQSWRYVALAVVLIDIYMNAAVTDWWGGGSYGARRMTADLPWIALGLANASRFVRPRWTTALAVLLCAYGLFTANVSRRGVQDLKLIFAGTSSDAPGAEREQPPVRDAASARAVARSSPINISHADYFAPPGRVTGGGRAATFAIMLAVLLGGAAFLSRRSPAGTLAALLAASALTTLLLHVRLSTGAAPDRVERRLWQRRAEETQAAVSGAPERTRGRREASPATPHAGATMVLAADAYDYLDAFRMLADGRGLEGSALVARLAAKGYPAARELAGQTREAGERRTLWQMIPGAFLAPEPGRAGRRLTVPGDRGPIRIEFDLRLGDFEPGARFPLAALEGAGGPILAAGLDGDGTLWLETASGRSAAIGALQRLGSYHLALSWDPAAGRGHLQASAARGTPAELEASPAAATPADGKPEGELTLLFGRRRGEARAYPLLGAYFSDLRVLTGAPAAP